MIVLDFARLGGFDTTIPLNFCPVAGVIVASSCKEFCILLYMDLEVLNICLVDAGLLYCLCVVQVNVIPKFVCFFVDPMLCITSDFHEGF